MWNGNILPVRQPYASDEAQRSNYPQLKSPLPLSLYYINGGNCEDKDTLEVFSDIFSSFAFRST